jgi:hypothetical protein
VEEYRKAFIKNFSKKAEIDVKRIMIGDYWLEVLQEKDKEIERLNKIINSFLAYLKGNEEHWKDTSYNWDSLIYGELAQRLEMKIKMSLEESDK